MGLVLALARHIQATDNPHLAYYSHVGHIYLYVFGYTVFCSVCDQLKLGEGNSHGSMHRSDTARSNSQVKPANVMQFDSKKYCVPLGKQ